MNEAKEIFLKYDGSYFHMFRDRQLSKYKSYNVDKKTEKKWLREYQKEILDQIQLGKSIDIFVSRFCNVMLQIEDDEYLDRLFNVLNQNLLNYDSFVRLRIVEEVQEVIVYFIKNRIGNIKKLAYYKSLMIDILKDVISQPIIISEDTRKNVIFEDTLKEENIKERAKQSLKKLE